MIRGYLAIVAATVLACALCVADSVVATGEIVTLLDTGFAGASRTDQRIALYESHGRN